METYSPTNFRKQSSNILKSVADSKNPVRVTLSSKEGPNKNVVLLSEEEYIQMEKAIREKYAAKITKIVKNNDPQILKSERELEDWLDEDQ